MVDEHAFPPTDGSAVRYTNNEKLKSARNEHKNESFYAYENVMRL